MSKKHINASDINMFCYCSLKWHYTLKYGEDKLEQMAVEAKKQFRSISKKYQTNKPYRNRLKEGTRRHKAWQQQIYTNKKSYPLRSIVIFLCFLSLLTQPVQVTICLIFLGSLLFALYKVFWEKEEEQKLRPSYEGEVAYADNNSSPYEETLHSFKYRICGKPDGVQKLDDGTYYLLEKKSNSTNNTGKAYFNDTMQLACYFILTEEHYGLCPVGVIEYENFRVQIENTPELKAKLLKTVSYMHYLVKSGTSPKRPKFISKNKCRDCNCKYTVCEVYGNWGKAPKTSP